MLCRRGNRTDDEVYRTEDKQWISEDDVDPALEEKYRLSKPKADYVAYFPIFDFKARNPTFPPTGDDPNRSNRWLWNKNPNDNLYGNFSRKVLEHLDERGLQPNPAGIFRRKQPKGVTKENIKGSEYFCYPWLIVEYKAGHVDNYQVKRAHRQAANAAAVSLKMYRNLSRYSKSSVDENSTDDRHVLPVTTMTTAGSKVKMWIAYSSNNEADCVRSPCHARPSIFADHPTQHMVCIWAGDVQTFGDIIKLEAILENLHTWATRELRPRISAYLDQWLHVHPLPAHRTPGSRANAEPDIREELSYEHALVPSPRGSRTRPPPVDPDESTDSLRTMLKALLKSEHEELLEQIQLTMEAYLSGDKQRQKTRQSEPVFRRAISGSLSPPPHRDVADHTKKDSLSGDSKDYAGPSSNSEEPPGLFDYFGSPSRRLFDTSEEYSGRSFDADFSPGDAPTPLKRVQTIDSVLNDAMESLLDETNESSAGEESDSTPNKEASSTPSKEAGSAPSKEAGSAPSKKAGSNPSKALNKAVDPTPYETIQAIPTASQTLSEAQASSGSDRLLSRRDDVGIDTSQLPLAKGIDPILTDGKIKSKVSLNMSEQPSSETTDDNRDDGADHDRQTPEPATSEPAKPKTKLSTELPHRSPFRFGRGSAAPFAFQAATEPRIRSKMKPHVGDSSKPIASDKRIASAVRDKQEDRSVFSSLSRYVEKS